MTDMRAQDYFEFIAGLGITKHPGSMEATRELVERCKIGPGKVVLDVGCGVGATPCFLAKRYGCRVIGVDLLDEMIVQARSRAKKQGLEDLVEFRVADGRDLPFDDNSFDATITESVAVFFDDKPAALQEFVRVTRPGGYVGLNEMSWFESPSPEMVDYFRRVIFADALDSQGWMRLMGEAGLDDVAGEDYPIDLPAEGRGRIERYGCSGIFGAALNMLRMFIRDKRSRYYLREGTGGLSREMFRMVGYGVFAGRKP
jgi:SAM-dependent methyltransferase